MTNAARLQVLLATAAASLVLTATAEAQTVTVGGDFSTPIIEQAGCPFGCSAIIASASSPSSGTVAPFDGTVTAWRIEGSGPTPGYGAAVFRKNSDGTYTETASSPLVTPAGPGIETFRVSLPIKAGEFVGTIEPEGAEIDFLEGESLETFFFPAVGPNQTQKPEGDFNNKFIIAFNADIEATPPPVPAPPAPAPVPTCTVPKLAGKKLKAVRKTLTKADCKVGKVAKENGVTGKTGEVVKQRPKPDTIVAAGSKVFVKLG